jgi:hypothetical protein
MEGFSFGGASGAINDRAIYRKKVWVGEVGSERTVRRRDAVFCFDAGLFSCTLR